MLNLEQVQTSHGFLPEVKFCANNIKLIIIRPEIIERDKLILKSVGMNESAVDQFFNSSPYAMKKQMKSNAASMKEIFKEIGPALFKQGIMRIEIDHKSISRETNDSEKHGYGIIAVLSVDNTHERYMMAFVATDRTDTEMNETLLENCLKVLKIRFE